jgi:hypothetical protein
LLSHRAHILQALRFTESAHEASTLYPRPAQQAPLGENDGPGNHAEQKKQKKNRFGDRTRFPNEINNLAADHYCQPWKKMHWF